MKSTLDSLKSDQIRTLALFYDSNEFKALKALVELERLQLAKDHVDQLDIMQVRYLSGQAAGLKKLIGTLEQNYKNYQKNG